MARSVACLKKTGARRRKKMSFIPNTTPTPNWLYNGEMKKMNETELKVVLLTTRKTLGWFDPSGRERKTQDFISQRQFKEFTGQQSEAISKAIQSSIEHGWIIARDKNGDLCDTPDKRRRRKIWYQLGSVFTNKISYSESEQDNKNPKNLIRFSDKSYSESEVNLIRKANNTKYNKYNYTKEEKKSEEKLKMQTKLAQVKSELKNKGIL